jgi:hypothetical protein
MRDRQRGCVVELYMCLLHGRRRRNVVTKLCEEMTCVRGPICHAVSLFWILANKNIKGVEFVSKRLKSNLLKKKNEEEEEESP